MSEWQTIETAPTDGKPILGYEKPWKDWAGIEMPRHVVVVHSVGKWYACTDYHGNEEECDLTHWMPLPEPPK